MLSEHFSEFEMCCHHCGQLPSGGISSVLLSKLELLRARLGTPIIVTNAYRCPTHNANVGGVWNSQHVKGTAADIWAPGYSVDALANAAAEVGFDGVGRYYRQQFVHVDVRDGGESPNYYTWTDFD